MLLLLEISSVKTLQDNIFTLYERQNNKISAKCRGAWIIVSNGYHVWSITVSPFIKSNSGDKICQSEWLQSSRKYVECTPCILKGHWRLLKTGVHLHSTETIDLVQLTYCVFHIMLLEINGRDQSWDAIHVPTSVWEGKMRDLYVGIVSIVIQNILSPAK